MIRTSALDLFENGLRGSWANGWGDGTPMLVTGGVAKGQGAFSGSYFIPTGKVKNGQIWTTLAVAPTGSDAVLLHFRARNPSGEGPPDTNVHGYWLRIKVGGFDLSLFDGGVETVLATSAALTVAAGDTWLVDFVEGAIVVEQNGTVVGSATNTVLPEGFLGIEFIGTSAQLADFGGGPVIGGKPRVDWLRTDRWPFALNKRGPNPEGSLERSALYPRIHQDIPAAGGPVTFDAAIAGQGAVGVDMVVQRALDSIIAGQGAVAVPMVVTRSLDAQVAGLGAVGATMSPVRGLAATVAGLGAVSDALAVTRAISVVVSGQGTVVAQLAPTRGIAAAVAGQGTVSAAIAKVASLAASVAGQGTVAVALARTRSLGVGVAGQGTLVVAITVSGSGVVSMAVAVTGQGLVAAGLSPRIGMQASVQGAGTVQAAYFFKRLVDAVEDCDPAELLAAVCDVVDVSPLGDIVNVGEMRVGTFKVGQHGPHCDVIGPFEVVDIGERKIGMFKIGERVFDLDCDTFDLTPAGTHVVNIGEHDIGEFVIGETTSGPDKLVLVAADPEEA